MSISSHFQSITYSSLYQCSLAILLFANLTFSHAKPTDLANINPAYKVVYPKPIGNLDPRQDYFIELIRLALEKTQQDYGDFQLDLYDQDFPPNRTARFVVQNQFVNIISSPATKQLSNDMLAIPFPLLMGVQGLRVPLVHNSRTDLFADIEQLSEMRDIVFAQGFSWVDTKILRDAKLNVETSTQYESLFAMLAKKRVDAVLRGTNEVLPELDSFNLTYANLVADHHVAFYYPLPVYFYVAKNNQKLAERLLAGLKLAKQDASLQALFDRNYAQHLAQLKLTERKLFLLKNTYLPAETEALLFDFLHPYIQQNLLAVPATSERLSEEPEAKSETAS